MREPKPIPMELKIWAAALTHTCNTQGCLLSITMHNKMNYNNSIYSLLQHQLMVHMWETEPVHTLFYVPLVFIFLSYLHREQLVPFRHNEEFYSIYCSRKHHIIDQQGNQDNIREQSCEIHHLQTEKLGLSWTVGPFVSFLCLCSTLPVDFTPLKMQR